MVGWTYMSTHLFHIIQNAQLHKQEFENSSSGSSSSKVIIIIIIICFIIIIITIIIIIIIIIIVAVVVVIMNYLFLVGITYIYTNSSLTKKTNKSQLLAQWNDTAKTQL